MVEVVRQRQVGVLHPYMVEVYVARDGSEACLSLNPPKAYCARDGAVKEVWLELEFSRYEVYEEKMRDVQTQVAISIHHSGERIRKTTLTVFSSPLCFCIEMPPRCGWRRLKSWGFLQSWRRRRGRLRLASRKPPGG
jgi:hypothetical protein